MTLRVLFVALAIVSHYVNFGQKQLPAVSLREGQLVYFQDSLGNRLPDFSYAGFAASEKAIPSVPAVVFVSHKDGDQTERIQKAIDYVSSLPLQKDGFRGAVLLDAGVFEIAGGLVIKDSGVVLRGSGIKKTTLVGAGLDRTTLIKIVGQQDQKLGDPIKILDRYVPVNATSFQVASAGNLKVGDQILIERPSTQEWIDALSMGYFGGETGYLGWKPDRRNIEWNRTIIAIDGNEITIDAPITTALEVEFGGGLVYPSVWNGRIANVGVENLTLESTYNQDNPKDEQHRWSAIVMESIKDGWVRQVDFKHFAGSAVALLHGASRVTVEDCRSFEPISEIGGQRRYTFYTEGEQCLFQRIYAEYGYHDFAVGFRAAGPNAFVQCQSFLPHSFSGAIDSWASGVLFDIVNVNAHALRFANRGMENQGAGWTAANSVFYQCSAALIECSAPPTAMNWAVGAWSQFAGNGDWYEANSHVKPRSLFYGQLKDRLKQEMDLESKLLPWTSEASSSPEYDVAAELTADAYAPAPELVDWIGTANERNPISTNVGKITSVDKIKSKAEHEIVANKQLRLKDGKFVIDGAIARGDRLPVKWWRGDVRYYETEKTSPHVTRFVASKDAFGLTDVLKETADWMQLENKLILDHNYGLWYDRRRDDHERVRRMNGEAWAPFYEMPFARSGQGTAYDGMSKYDLSKYNFWYWRRLSDFAQLAENQGLILYHQNYFQHNILEAGGHYADFPWRTANNINATPFPEPVNYAGDKRIFFAEQFYDVSNPEYQALHKAYIRQCLVNFRGQQNVIQFTSAEYTGPLSFMQFWLDVIKDWQDETGERPKVALSATKDVMDAILQDPKYADLIDAVDIRYWWYGVAKDGSMVLYAPEGGKQLAPRQHARLVRTPKETFESTYKAVRIYTDQYPDKAVLHHTHRSAAFGWAVFMAGGSLMNIPKISDDQFLVDAVSMRPTFAEGGKYVLAAEKGGQIIYQNEGEVITIDLTGQSGSFEMMWVNPSTGEVIAGNQKVKGGEVVTVKKASSILWLKQ